MAPKAEVHQNHEDHLHNLVQVLLEYEHCHGDHLHTRYQAVAEPKPTHLHQLCHDQPAEPVHDRPDRACLFHDGRTDPHVVTHHGVLVADELPREHSEGSYGDGASEQSGSQAHLERVEVVGPVLGLRRPEAEQHRERGVAQPE